MPNQRIEIIVKEINYWKKNKLLPDVYCDFLLALYTEGEGVKGNPDHKKSKLAPVFQLLVQTILLLLSIIIINLKESNLLFTVIFLGLSLLIMLWMFRKQNKQYQTYFYLSITILLVFILLVSVYISNIYVASPWVINLVVALNFVGWFFIARKFRLKYLGVVSIFSFIFACVYAFF